MYLDIVPLTHWIRAIQSFSRAIRLVHQRECSPVGNRRRATLGIQILQCSYLKHIIIIIIFFFSFK
jgi:hypothetical protein